MYEWLTVALVVLGIWAAIFVARPFVRREMFLVSLFTMPFALLELLLIPKYWDPPSLFNLDATIGFDIESFIFSFAIGGIAAVVYEVIGNVRHHKMDKKEVSHNRRLIHKLAIISPALVFIPLYFLTNLNPIYSISIATLVGGVSSILCRPDLKRKMMIGGLLFLVSYFLFFLGVNVIYPYFVNYWNLSALSGILILGVPIEELMFAFTFGVLWSSIYEHVFGYRL